ncbi:hypothetical protein DVK85_04830 [Flavobacterium arcticum]|uniref:DUF4890 domain-containing protein n=1 Tax=Flavobacterium arcticum TaxID=1784713 RepID=A0A345HAH8_9FLAO|nr:hypothetical protein [Flavobacterium arcticum]AXG73588.1 hypothetical protein DVK85_04830 [Flavobacterium arcticum]KAF2506433.1 hypothetical protein E0W72_13330 [Flavobacterium arcticum]
MNKIITALKGTVAIVLLLVTFTTIATAQSKADEGALAVTVKMKEQLSLNDAQYNQVLQINKEYLNRIVKAKKTVKSVPAREKKIKIYSADREKKLKSVLTDAQYRTYAADRAKNQEFLKEYY